MLRRLDSTFRMLFFIPPESKSVLNEVVLITGAAHGLGQAMACEFAKLGAIVVIWDINIKGLQETKDKITTTGGKCHSYFCDVRDRDQVRSVGDKVRQDVGDVTILVNSAGKVVGKQLLELKDAEIEDTFAVNLLAPIWTTKEFLPSILANNHGHIVNISSSCGLIGIKQLVDYSASKFGVTGFTQTLNFEIHFSGHDGVHTTLVCPSYTKTGMFKGCKMAYPSILPDLEVQPTVKRIMKAILTNQNEVYIPRMVYVMAALKNMLPVNAMQEIVRFVQADKFMETFEGGHQTST
nr:17 beta-hydroxysteroid dehydrogenase [Biomphalaria glabrata]